MKAKFNFISSIDKTTLAVSGDLIVATSKEFKLQLLSLLDSGDSLELSLSETEAVDVSALQLIYAFQNEAKSLNKKFSIVPPSHLELTSLLSRTGLSVVMNAKNETND